MDCNEVSCEYIVACCVCSATSKFMRVSDLASAFIRRSPLHFQVQSFTTSLLESLLVPLISVKCLDPFVGCELASAPVGATLRPDWSPSPSPSHIATDGHSVSKSWYRAPSGAHDQIFITVWHLLALASAVFLGSESLGTRDHILLSQILNFPFRRLLRLAGSRWRAPCKRLWFPPAVVQRTWESVSTEVYRLL
jgi:hypothetical protein